MRHYYPVDLAGNTNIIEKLVLSGTGTGDLPIRAACGRAGLPTGRAGPSLAGPGFQRAGPGQAWPGRHSNYLQRAWPNIRTGRAGPENSGRLQFFY